MYYNLNKNDPSGYMIGFNFVHCT